MSTVAELYPDPDDFEDLLSEAEGSADSNFEIEFTSDMRERYEQYGKIMFLSPKQHEVLLRIAGWD